MNVERLQEILNQKLFYFKCYSYGAAVHFELPEKTDAEKIAETPLNIDHLGLRDFKNLERIIKECQQKNLSKN